VANSDQFSHNIINKMVSNAVGEGLILDTEDYDCILKVFHQLGGSWEKVLGGEDGTVSMLNKVVTKWILLEDRPQPQ